jgi:hypothetical protein
VDFNTYKARQAARREARRRPQVVRLQTAGERLARVMVGLTLLSLTWLALFYLSWDSIACNAREGKCTVMTWTPFPPPRARTFRISEITAVERVVDFMPNTRGGFVCRSSHPCPTYLTRIHITSGDLDLMPKFLDQNDPLFLSTRQQLEALIHGQAESFHYRSPPFEWVGSLFALAIAALTTYGAVWFFRRARRDSVE